MILPASTARLDKRVKCNQFRNQRDGFRLGFNPTTSF